MLDTFHSPFFIYQNADIHWCLQSMANSPIYRIIIGSWLWCVICRYTMLHDDNDDENTDEDDDDELIVV